MATTASSVTSGGVLTVASVANLMVGQTVRLSGTQFGGLSNSTTYYIRAIVASTISLSLTSGGGALSISGGTGTMVVTPGPSLGPGVGDIISVGSTTLSDPKYGDFNSIQGLVAKVLGAPTSDDPRYGYNQILTSAPVAFGNKVSLSQWANLRTDMIKARGHQTGSASESNNIELPTVSSKITEALRLAFFNYATTLTTFRDVVAANQLEAVTASTAVRIDDWNGVLTSTITVNFGDLATARGYFNAGGQIKISAVLNGPFGSAATTKANTWATMFASMGTITMDRTTTFLDLGSSGTPSNLGYFGLTGTHQRIFLKSAPTGSYSPNQFVITARISSGAVEFIITYEDLDDGSLNSGGNIRPTLGYTDVAPPAGTSEFVTTVVDEYIDGELRQVVALARPTGSYVSIPTPVTTITGDLTTTQSNVFGMVASVYTITEGQSVTVTLKTQGVSDGVSFQYTVTGIAADSLSVGSLTGSFTVFNNIASTSFTLSNDLRTEGQDIMTVALNNGQASTTIKIDDTSRNPVGAALFTTPGPGQPWICPAGVRNISILVIGGGAGGSSTAGGGGGGGAVNVYNTPTQPGQTYFVNVGAGGGPGSSGSSSDWAGFASVGGSVGTNGSSSGNAGPHTGGTGGSTFGGGGGGSGSGNATTTMQAAGGGGGGRGGSGAPAASAFQGGNGGIGYMVTWFNNFTIFASGGGGGGATNRGGGSSYGGANGASGNNVGDNASPSLGGGGGGGGAYPSDATRNATLSGAAGGSGGSGRVWIKWS